LQQADMVMFIISLPMQWEAMLQQLGKLINKVQRFQTLALPRFTQHAYLFQEIINQN
jgi:hypothetical protein